MRRALRGVIGLMSCAACLVFAPNIVVPALGYSCSNTGAYRTQDIGYNSSPIGVTGQIYTPDSGSMYNTGSDLPAAADVVLDNASADDFLQYGWYLGGFGSQPGSSGLPTVTTPHIFWGEYDTALSYEYLHEGAALSWSTAYGFQILQTTTGGYHFILNGTYQNSNQYGHGSLPAALAQGETQVECTTMYAFVERHPEPPLSTLYYATGSPSSPTWTLFNDFYALSSDAADAGSGVYTAMSAGAAGTLYGYGGG